MPRHSDFAWPRPAMSHMEARELASRFRECAGRELSLELRDMVDAACASVPVGAGKRDPRAHEAFRALATPENVLRLAAELRRMDIPRHWLLRESCSVSSA